MAEDPLDVLMRMLKRARDLEERIASLASIAWMGEPGYPPSLDEVEQELVEGVIQPLFTVEDLGEELAIAVDLAGAADDVSVKVYRDRVEVEAALRREAVERAAGYSRWSLEQARYRAVIPLSHPVDPSTARVERRRGLVVIFVRKAGP